MTPREKIDQEVYLLVRGRLGNRASEEDVAMLTNLTCEAIDAATKPLREEVERLKAELADAKDRVEAIRELRQIETDQACAFADQSAKLADERADQTEARNKALVEALKAYVNGLDAWESGQVNVREWLDIQAKTQKLARAALAAHEERSKPQEPQP